MANTKISFLTYQDQTLTAFLTNLTGTGTPNPSGYAASDTLNNGLYLATIPEALIGEFSIKAIDTDDEIAFHGYVSLNDDTETYRCYDYVNVDLDLSSVLSAINSLSASIVIPAASVPSNAETDDFSLFKGTEWNFSISGIGLEADDFYFTMKSVNSREDSEADLQINTSGTTYITQEEYITTSGTLTYTSGTVDIYVSPEVTDMLVAGRKYNWDIKGINETTVRSYGMMTVNNPTTRRI